MNVKKLTDLANYQEGIVASRTLVDKDACTVTLFAFDKGQGLSEHTTPYDAMVYVIDGETEIVISGKSHILKMGDTITMPANEPHKVNAIEKFKMLLIMVKS